MTLTFDLTHDLDLGCFKVKFRNCIRNCWSDLCETKRKRIDGILGWLYDIDLWPHPWPWPWSFKVKVWNSLISGMGRPIDMERIGCESLTMILTSVTVVGWADVPDNDRGDFRRRRAVDISSLQWIHVVCLPIFFRIASLATKQSFGRGPFLLTWINFNPKMDK